MNYILLIISKIINILLYFCRCNEIIRIYFKYNQFFKFKSELKLN